MAGIIVVLGILSLSSTLFATLTNLIITRDYPLYWTNRKMRQNPVALHNLNEVEVELGRAPLAKGDLLRLAAFQQIATVFYHQALLLWALLLVALWFGVGLDVFHSY